MRGNLLATLGLLCLGFLVAPVTAKQPGGASATGLGLEEYCPVTLHAIRQWQKGAPEYEFTSMGRCHRLASKEAYKTFTGDPAQYAPVGKGLEPVAMAAGQILPGERSHGVFYNDRMYLFASEANLQMFWNNPDQYITPAEP